MTNNRGISWPKIGAESAAIVASILLAFAIDAGWQNHTDSALETEYLQRLDSDLHFDLSLWNGLSEGGIPGRGGSIEETKNAALRSAQVWIRKQDYSAVALRQLVADLVIGTRLAYEAGTDSRRTTFDELVSTGRLNLIRDSELRTALSQYYAGVNVQRGRIVNRQTAYAAVVYELVPRESEFVPQHDIALEQLRRIGERVTEERFGDLVTAELNRGRLRQEIASLLVADASSVVDLIETRLSGGR